ncbi:MAG: GatB/YqeY domain-containing protein [Bacteroidota bacterium]|nr:GatB/YqeY domain-containing protein [Bacteroidota bacterium]MDX5431845.1 GatB/YqeY domain-containing protein [Bacteroidota bacterium]MDX5470556.1 GatB/YqeY domain-containing protein [Bacteroidota bacterium]
MDAFITILNPWSIVYGPWSLTMYEQISKDLIGAIKSRDQGEIRSLQSIKAQLQLLRTEKGGGEPGEEEELKVLMRMAKQRRDSIEIFAKENRSDLVEKEQEELKVIERYLPAQMSDAELEVEVQKIITSTGASSMAQMGMVMGQASKALAGKADGKRISEMVKRLLG